MKTVIDRSASERHSIDKYKFKVLAMGATSEPEVEVKRSVLVASDEMPQIAEPVLEEAPQAEELSAGSKDELVESLLKKADEMSSSVIKMQMKLEEAEANYKQQLEEERTKAYEEGVQTGRTQILEESEQKQQEGLNQFAVSVQTLEARAGEFTEALGAVREELIHAAIDIAKEVVTLEVGERSSDIAKQLASQLIEELQEASKITLRVNPADHGPISEAVGTMERIEVVSDSAVNRGGVIAISNAGNIDAEVMKRFERVKNAALS